MKKIAALCIFLLIVCSLLAQKSKVYVELNNGSVLKGKLLETESGQKIRLQWKENIYVLPKSKVDTVVTNKYNLHYDDIDVPWFFNAEYGILFGGSGSEEDEISFFHGIFNYRLMPKGYVGLGGGIEYYHNRSFVPLFAHTQYWFRATKFSPFVFLKAGYLVPAEKKKVSSVWSYENPGTLPPQYLNSSGGFLISPGLGINRWLGPNFGLSLSAAYRYHEINYSGKEEYELEYRYNRFCLTLGIIFK